MKPKQPVSLNRLEPEILKLKLPKVDFIEIPKGYEERKILKALPYYLIVYGANLEKFAPYLPDLRARFILRIVGKAMNWLLNYLNLKGGK